MCKIQYKNKLGRNDKYNSCSIIRQFPNKEIPHDKDGFCLFHSKDIKWKLENNFNLHLTELIKELNDSENNRIIDLREFVFIADKNSNFELSDIEFKKSVFLNGARFIDDSILKNLKFTKKADFKSVIFNGKLEIIDTEVDNLNLENSTFNKIIVSNLKSNGLNFMYSKFEEKAIFENLFSKSYTEFSNAVFKDTASFNNCEFKSLVNFSSANFQAKNIYKKEARFENVKFNETVDFEQTNFNCMTTFLKTIFNKDASFIDTNFSMIKNIVLGRKNAVNFLDINVGESCIMEFKSSDAKNKIFKHDVYFRNEVIDGSMVFENVNFNKIDDKARIRLLKLQKENKVIIGRGCLKYLHQTETRTIFLNGNLQGLVVELMNTYSNFFIEHNGFNLGFEILERDDEKIEYFYFSDEPNLTKEQFEERLGKTEAELWTIVQNPEIVENAQTKIISNSQNIDNTEIENMNKTPMKTVQSFVDKFLYAKDLVVNITSSFFKIGSRISHNKISETELKKILNTIHFQNSGIKLDEKVVFQVINNNFNQTQLMYVNKNNTLEIKGNNNFVAQDLINSNIDNTKKTDN